MHKSKYPFISLARNKFPLLCSDSEIHIVIIDNSGSKNIKKKNEVVHDSMSFCVLFTHFSMYIIFKTNEVISQIWFTMTFVLLL